VPGDLTLKLSRISPVDPLGRQTQRRRINVKEASRTHLTIIAGGQIEFSFAFGHAGREVGLSDFAPLLLVA
jgi:hypothetical protein